MSKLYYRDGVFLLRLHYATHQYLSKESVVELEDDDGIFVVYFQPTAKDTSCFTANTLVLTGSGLMHWPDLIPLENFSHALNYWPEDFQRLRFVLKQLDSAATEEETVD